MSNEQLSMVNFQKTEVRGQKSEVRDQKDRRQRNRGQKLKCKTLIVIRKPGKR